MHHPPIGIALAAFGMSGEVFHAPLLTHNPHFVLKKIVTRQDRATQFYPQIPCTSSLEEVLHDPQVEVVVVNTPNPTHFALTKQALEAGKHVVVEKPFTVTLQEGRQLLDLARHKGLLLTVFHNRRWDGDFMTIQQVIQQKWLGEPVEYRASYDRFRNFVRSQTWKEEEGPGKGVLYDLGSHLIDQALQLFGLPQSITADIRIQRPEGQVPDNYVLWLHYGKLRVTLSTSYFVREPLPKYILHGLEGSFIKYGLDPQEEDLKEGKIPGLPGWGKENDKYWGNLNANLKGVAFKGAIETVAGSYPSFYHNLYKALRMGEPLAVLPEQALEVIGVIETAYESARLGKTLAYHPA
jgi:scyllo-inositol 2-dehydrogenase (NADP+)